MRKWIIIVIVLFIIVTLGIGGRMIWQKRQKDLLEHMRMVDELMHEQSTGDVRDNMVTVERFYADMAVMFKKIDSLDRSDLFKVDNGAEEFRNYLITESRNLPYNFRFLPYENVKWKVTAAWADSISITPTWPWSMCYQYKWSKFPVTDSATVRKAYMSSFYEELNYAAAGFREIDSLPYLLVLINFEEKDLNLFDGKALASDEFIQAEFDGAMIVYDMKAQQVVKAYPLKFEGSDSLSYTYTDDSRSTTASNAFREAYGNDLQSHFIEAVTKMINDSLGIPKTRIDINKY